MNTEQIGFTEQEIIQLVLREMEKLNETKVYFECRRAKIRYVYNSLPMIKCVVALQNLGLPISTRIVSFVLDKPQNNIIVKLHALGDKNILCLKRELGKSYSWVVAQWFLERIL